MIVRQLIYALLLLCFSLPQGLDAEQNTSIGPKVKEHPYGQAMTAEVSAEEEGNEAKSIGNNDKKTEEESLSKEESEKKELVKQLHKRKKKLDTELKKNNIWSKIYSNYHTYLFLKDTQKRVLKQIGLLHERKYMTDKEERRLSSLKEQSKTIKGKLQLLDEYKEDPFRELLKPEPIGEAPTVGNPIAIISALSFQKKILSQQDEYNARYSSLSLIISKLKEEKNILKELIKLEPGSREYHEELEDVESKLKTYEPVLEIFETTRSVYTKKIDEIRLKLRSEIRKEIEKTMMIGAILLFFFALFLFGKFLVHRYMSGNDRFYMINKALNITFVSFLVLILLFSYIENVNYLITVLGFASAGIAIAMKDWFMSLLGWFVIVIGGTIHVGDRVKFMRDGVAYVGDIVDISMLRITLHEDVTLTTYMENRRSGRMIFIPNNYIFTDMIANYSHAGLKTVWDGIDFVVTFDSDINKALSIAKEVSKKYSKGYTDITRKQLNKLRSSYSIRNTNVEPRIFSFIEPYGVKISVWYLTNAYATLTLRSTISGDIIQRIQEEREVSLAFPTQSVYLDKDVRKPPFSVDDVQGSDEVKH